MIPHGNSTSLPVTYKKWLVNLYVADRQPKCCKWDQLIGALQLQFVGSLRSCNVAVVVALHTLFWCVGIRPLWVRWCACLVVIVVCLYYCRHRCQRFYCRRYCRWCCYTLPADGHSPRDYAVHLLPLLLLCWCRGAGIGVDVCLLMPRPWYSRHYTVLLTGRGCGGGGGATTGGCPGACDRTGSVLVVSNRVEWSLVSPPPYLDFELEIRLTERETDQTLQLYPAVHIAIEEACRRVLFILTSLN